MREYWRDSMDKVKRGLHKNEWGPIFFQQSPKQAWLITVRNLLHDWKYQDQMLQPQTEKNVWNFKHAILIGNQLGVYSRLMINKTERKGSWKKKRKNL